MQTKSLLNKLIISCLVFTFALFVSTAYGQESTTISGTITAGDDDSALPGVNVLVKGSTEGTITDIDGKYSIECKTGDVLVYSFIGYLSEEVTIASQQTIDMSLSPDIASLEQVVVIGYGTRKKTDITGAVSSVKTDELTAFPVLDATQAIQGRAAGVVVQSNNGGEPGAPIGIKIRGNTSINASSAPLIVVDGFVGAEMPQAADIQSMEILKDASATAIYGSRGSNGIIMITTKKGKSGKVSVELNADYSINNTANRLDLLNADEFAAYQQAINPAYVQGSEDTDWQDLLYQTGNTQNYQLSFSGGSDRVNVYASGNYFNQEGVIINSGFEKLTFLSNIDAQINSKLKMGLSVTGGRETKNGVPTQSTGNTANGGGDDVVSLMFRFAPDVGPKDENGENTVQTKVGDNIDNPYAVATERVNEVKRDLFRTNAYLSWDIVEKLNFRTTVGYSTINRTEGNFQPSTLKEQAGGAGGRATLDELTQSSILSESYLTYTENIGKGILTLLGGFSYQKTSALEFGAGTEGLISDSFSFYNLGGASNPLTPSSSFAESEIQSLFARVNYDYDDKYLVTATVRRDGASNFAKNNKYAIFPSAALGWKLSNEDFLQNATTLSNLKLRASYGVTGNQAIDPYKSLASFVSLYSVTNGQTVNAVTPDQVANSDLRWESSYQTNFGIDVGLYTNRISFSFDYYNIDTKDLLLADASQPQYLGFATLASIRNVGEVNNTGYEFSLNTKNISKSNFSWTTDFVLSINRNKVVKLIDGIDVFLDASPSYFNIPRTHVLREGEAAGVFWGYEYRGVYQGGALPEGTAIFDGDEAGDPLYTDIPDEDGVYDGVISTADQKIIGDPNPDYDFGFTNDFSYKNFNLNIFFQGSQGGDIFNLTNVQLYNGDANALKDIKDAWTPTNTDTDIPRARVGRRDISSRFVEDGSYIRLKNIALGYNLPDNVNEKLGVRNIRLTISAQNLLTWTKYSGLDPEASYYADSEDNTGVSNTTNGFDFGNYPTIKSVNFSLNIKF